MTRPIQCYIVRGKGPLNGAMVRIVRKGDKSVNCELLESRGSYKAGDKVTLNMWELEEQK